MRRKDENICFIHKGYQVFYLKILHILYCNNSLRIFQIIDVSRFKILKQEYRPKTILLQVPLVTIIKDTVAVYNCVANV